MPARTTPVRGRPARAAAAARTAPRPTLALADGARAVVADDGALELVDGKGRLLVRYLDGHAEIHAPEGDLRLEAPSGRVVVRAARGVSLAAGQEAAPQLEVRPDCTRVACERLEVDSSVAEGRIGRVALAVRHLATTAATVAHNVERYELRATELVETARTVLREAVELAEHRAGRMRTLVEGLHALYARRNVQVSEEDTSIDGRRVLLG